MQTFSLTRGLPIKIIAQLKPKISKLIARYAVASEQNESELKSQFRKTKVSGRDSLVRMMEKVVRESFGGKLSQWRKSLNLEQKEVAAILDMSVKTYENWEYCQHLPNKFTRAQVLEIISKHVPRGTNTDHRHD